MNLPAALNLQLRLGHPQKKDGYLIVGEEVWNPETDLQDLPEAWLRRPKNGSVVPDSKKAARFPRKFWFDEYGNCSDSAAGDLNLCVSEISGGSFAAEWSLV
jgi:hypothetical protein